MVEGSFHVVFCIFKINLVLKHYVVRIHNLCTGQSKISKISPFLFIRDLIQSSLNILNWLLQLKPNLSIHPCVEYYGGWKGRWSVTHTNIFETFHFPKVLSGIHSDSFIGKIKWMHPDLGKIWEVSSKIIDSKYKIRLIIQLQNIKNKV